MASPWVRRALAEGQKANRKSTQPITITLGDKVAADKAIEKKATK